MFHVAQKFPVYESECLSVLSFLETYTEYNMLMSYDSILLPLPGTLYSKCYELSARGNLCFQR